MLCSISKTMKTFITIIPITIAISIAACNSPKKDSQEIQEAAKTENIINSTEKAFTEKGKATYDVNGETLSAKTEYQIIKAENFQDIKFTYEIRLSNSKLSEREIERLALELKSQLDRSYERIFITYYLPNEKIGAGAWATSHFDPNLKINILGITASDIEKLLESSKENNSEEIIGKWIAGGHGSTYFLILFKKDGKLFKAMRDDDENIEEEMIIKKVVGQERYIEKENNQFGEYYYINSKGELEVYDEQGFIEKYAKTK